METALVIAAWTLVALGALMGLVGGIGLVRLPDFYCRMHAAGITDTAGASLMLVGMILHALLYLGLPLIAIKLLAILFFVLVTSPTATHALSAAALSDGPEPILDGSRAKRRGGGSSRS